MSRILAVSLLLVSLGHAPACVAMTADDNAATTTSASTAPPQSTAALQDDPVTIDDSALTPVAGRPCGSEKNLKSLKSDTRTFLRFRNATSTDVTYYWINFEGNREMKRTLKPGEGYSLWTYLTHPFIVVDSKDACATVYMPQKEHGLVVISKTP